MGKLRIYTDGSYRDGIGTWSFVVTRGGKLKTTRYGRALSSISDAIETRNTVSELAAIRQAVQYCIDNRYINISIYTDFHTAMYHLRHAKKTQNDFIRNWALWMRSNQGVYWLYRANKKDWQHKMAHHLARNYAIELGDNND